MRGWAFWQRVTTEDIRIADVVWETRFLLAYTTFYIFLAIPTGLMIRAYPVPLAGSGQWNQDLWYLSFKIIGLLVVPVAVFSARGYRPRDLLAGGASRVRLWWLLPSFALGLSPNLGHLDAIADLASGLPRSTAVLGIAAGALLPLVSAALPEEIVYRGLLQTRLEIASGRVAAVIATALLFVAWHLPTRFLLSDGVEGQGGDLVSVLMGTGLPVLLVALVLGILWDRYRNLPCLIAAHWGIDALPAVRSMLGGSF